MSRPAKAVYRDHKIPQWKGNPLLAALPPLLTDKQARDLVKRRPEYDEADRRRAPHVRKRLVDSVWDLFVVTDQTLSLLDQVDASLRAGYATRNPMRDTWWSERRATLQRLRYTDAESGVRASSLGFKVIGMGGLGKSASMARVLSLYPQVIEHDFADHTFTETQVTHLMVHTPHDSTPAGLCKAIIRTFSNLLGDPELAESYRPYRKVDDLIDVVARLASRTHLGLLVVDEIQNLTNGRKDKQIRVAAQTLVQYLVQLNNEVGVPVALIGDYHANRALESRFHELRRTIGGGEVTWSRLHGEEWDTFLDELWKYQYTKTFTGIGKELKQTLFNITFGIPDFTIHLFIAAQKLAILSGREELSEEVLESAARRFPKTVACLNILRLGGTDDLVDYYLEEPIAALDVLESARDAGGPREVPAGETEAVPGLTDGAASTSRPQKTPQRAAPLARAASRMSEVVKEGKLKGLDAHEALQREGIVAPPLASGGGVVSTGPP